MSNLSPTTIRFCSGGVPSRSMNDPNVDTSIAPILTYISSSTSPLNLQRAVAFRVFIISSSVALTLRTSFADFGWGIKNSPRSNTHSSPRSFPPESIIGTERMSFLSMASIIEKHEASSCIFIKSAFIASFARALTSPTNWGRAAENFSSILSILAFEFPQRAAL